MKKKAPGKKVLIEIKGTQKNDFGFADEIELYTEGTLAKIDDNDYEITYFDTDADFPDGVKTVVTVGSDVVTVAREPFPGGRMTVQEARRHLCHYETLYGSMMLGVFGKKVSSTLTETGGELYMRYTVDINSELAGENEIRLSVREA